MATQREQREQLITHLKGLLEQLYEIGDGHDGAEGWERHRARVRGFQEAARLLGLLSLEDVQSIIDAAHLEILGESRLERRERLDGLAAKVERGEWGDFEGPAYERYKPKP